MGICESSEIPSRRSYTLSNDSKDFIIKELNINKDIYEKDSFTEKERLPLKYLIHIERIKVFYYWVY